MVRRRTRHSLRPHCHLGRVLAGVGNVNLSFSMSYLSCLIFGNGSLEKIPDSVLRELFDLGQCLPLSSPPRNYSECMRGSEAL